VTDDEWSNAKQRIKELVDGIDSLAYGHGHRSDDDSRESDWQSIRYKLLLLNIDCKWS
jgi:hypothetical protein